MNTLSASLVSLFIGFVCMAFWCAMLLTWWERTGASMFKRWWKKRRKEPGMKKGAEEQFKETFDLMEELFGKSSKISTDGLHMYVVCRHCDKKNRLRAGIEGANCGSCKRSLRKQVGEIPPATQRDSAFVN